MNPEHEKYLSDHFPFLRPSGGLQKSLMYFGCENGDGWFELIKQLCIDLVPVVHDDFRVVQVKEKYGSLRFYPNSATDAAWKLIEEAENRSYTICEECGKPGRRNKLGWIKTLCKPCRGLRVMRGSRWFGKDHSLRLTRANRDLQ